MESKTLSVAEFEGVEMIAIGVQVKEKNERQALEGQILQMIHDGFSVQSIGKSKLSFLDRINLIYSCCSNSSTTSVSSTPPS